MGKWIKDNIPWIVTSLATFVMGIAANQVKVSGMDARIKAIETAQAGRRLFIGGVSSRLEFLCNRDPECRDRYNPLETPE